MRNAWCVITAILAVVCFITTPAGATEVPSVYAQRFTISHRDSAYLDSVAGWYMDSCHAPGLTDLIMKDGEIIWIGHYGFSNIEQQLPPNDSTSWDAGSIAKTVTAVAAMKAWEDSFYELDADINDYLPFTVINPFYPNDLISQLMLLTHNSSIAQIGLDNLTNFSGDPIIQLDTALYNYLHPAGYWYTAGSYSSVPPGSVCNYSNIAIGLAGYFTQVVTGDSLPLYCRQHILDPLGMNHTSWWYSELDTNNVAIQYDYDSYSGQYFRCGSGRVSNSCYPAGQMKFSAIDLSRFLLAFMQYGRLDTVRILDSTTVALMRTIQDTIVDGQFVCPIGITWWCWHSPSTGSQVWGHAGRDWGASAVMAYYESLDIGVVILSNGEINSLTHLLAGMVPTLVHWAMQYGVAENTIEPANVAKLQVLPNPFSQITDIRYQMTDHGRRNGEVGTTLRVYDATGRLVRDFGPLSVIGHPLSVKWDGTDQANRQLGSGVYFIKLASGNIEETRKVLLVR